MPNYFLETMIMYSMDLRIAALNLTANFVVLDKFRRIGGIHRGTICRWVKRIKQVRKVQKVQKNLERYSRIDRLVKNYLVES